MTVSFIHSLLAHLTIGLLTGATIFFVLSLLFDTSEFANNLRIAGIANLWLCSIVTILSVLFGLLSFNTDGLVDDTVSQMADHRHWAYLALFLIGIVSLWSVQARKSTGIPFVAFLVITFICTLVSTTKGMSI